MQFTAFSQKFFAGSLLMSPALGWVGQGRLNNNVPPPEFWSQLKQGGKNWGSLRGKIFASLLTAPKARLGWERLHSLAPSREAKQNIFQFHSEENFARALLKEKEKNVLLCAAVRRAKPRGGVCARQGADCRSKKVRAKCIITAPKLTLSEVIAPLVVRAADGSLRKIKSAFVFAVKSQSSPQ